MTQLFLDTEFTGLTQETTLLSLALIDQHENTFYAEFTDHNPALIDPWIEENVIANMRWLNDSNRTPFFEKVELENGLTQHWVYGNTKAILSELEAWLSGYDTIEMWADCPAYDWVLFCQLFNGSLNLPKNMSYVIHDFATLLRVKDQDPLTPRTSLLLDSELPETGELHNALYDAMTLKKCVETFLP